MREYIFRGKRVDNGEWIYGSLSWFTDGSPIEITMVERPKGNDKWTRVVAPETVGQYSGLCDKNGNKIWEGDILVESKKRGGFDEWCYRYEVVYTSDDVGSCGCCNAEFSGIGFVFQSIIGTRFRGKFDELEIIGNIHDNPELLEVK